MKIHYSGGLFHVLSKRLQCYSICRLEHKFVLFVYLCVWKMFPLLRGAAVLLSLSRSRAGHCICVLCITSCLRLWIVSKTIECFALKGTSIIYH